LNIGESFVETSEDQAKDYVIKEQLKYENQKKNFIEKYEKNKKRLDELKIVLYSKFGKRLHLEED
jgi:chaperonin cofactor prefoldin